MSIFTNIRTRLSKINRRTLLIVGGVVLLVVLYVLFAVVLRTPEQKAVDTINWKVAPESATQTKKTAFTSKEYDIFYL